MSVFDPITGEPAEFVQGDYIAWRPVGWSVYATAEYTMVYRFRPAKGGNLIEVSATIDAGDWLVVLTGTDNARMLGRYYWQAQVVRVADTATFTLNSGQVMVHAAAAEENGDTRTHARKVLDKIEALIEGRADNDIESYTIAGRQVNKMTADELMTWRGYYQAEVKAEEDSALIAAGKSPQNSVRMRFV